MKTVTADQMRGFEKRMAEELGVPASTLMDRAGFGVASFVKQIIDASPAPGRSVLLIAGTGNNGGDVFAAAGYLRDAGINPCVVLCGDKGKVKEPALQYLKELESSGIDVEQMETPSDWTDPANDYIYSLFPVIVDGLLGTGLKGAVSEPAASAVNFINRMSKKALVVSIDLPSGMDSDTGAAQGPVIRADFTLAAGYPKRGFLAGSAVECIGSLRLVDIGMPDYFLNDISESRGVITSSELCSTIGRRHADSHKGTYGHLLVIAGARGFSGAAVMSAMSSLRAGAGLVTVLAPESVVPQISAAVPEAMVHPVKETRSGALSYGGFKTWRDKLDDFDAILVGPGLTTSSDTLDIVKSLIEISKMPVLADADALNVLEGRLDFFRKAKCPIILTPHPGEAGRLLGRSIKDIQADRFKTAAEMAGLSGAVVVLKGAGTIVAGSSGESCICLAGNPGMATAGSGDVLSGLIAGLLAQRIDPYQSARSGVLLHGLAGDLASLKTSQAGINAMDISAAVPSVIGSVCGR